MKIDYQKLQEFLFDANKNGYAGDVKEIKPQRPGFKEMEYRKGNWYFRDSYSGFFMAPGQEVVYFKNNPIWAMSYSGGMIDGFRENQDFAIKTFQFLKKTLLKMNPENPFRGPENFSEKDWEYKSQLMGDVVDFAGNEQIFYQGKLVFSQNFMGGLIISK